MCKTLSGNTISSICEQAQDIMKWPDSAGGMKNLALVVSFDNERQKYFGLLFDNEKKVDIFKCLADEISSKE